MLRNKLLNDESSPSPSKFLEIKKLKIQNEIKLEIWDTTPKILSSPMIQSKFISFSAYYKISDGIVYVCDYFNKDSITFIINQLNSFEVNK